MSAGTEARSPDEQSSMPLGERARGCPTAAEVVAQFGHELVFVSHGGTPFAGKVLIGSFRPGKASPPALWMEVGEVATEAVGLRSAAASFSSTGHKGVYTTIGPLHLPPKSGRQNGPLETFVRHRPRWRRRLEGGGRVRAGGRRVPSGGDRGGGHAAFESQQHRSQGRVPCSTQKTK